MSTNQLYTDPHSPNNNINNMDNQFNCCSITGIDDIQVEIDQSHLKNDVQKGEFEILEQNTINTNSLDIRNVIDLQPTILDLYNNLDLFQPENNPQELIDDTKNTSLETNIISPNNPQNNAQNVTTIQPLKKKIFVPPPSTPPPQSLPTAPRTSPIPPPPPSRPTQPFNPSPAFNGVVVEDRMVPVVICGPSGSGRKTVGEWITLGFTDPSNNFHKYIYTTPLYSLVDELQRRVNVRLTSVGIDNGDIGALRLALMEKMYRTIICCVDTTTTNSFRSLQKWTKKIFKQGNNDDIVCRIVLGSGIEKIGRLQRQDVKECGDVINGTSTTPSQNGTNFQKLRNPIRNFTHKLPLSRHSIESIQRKHINTKKNNGSRGLNYQMRPSQHIYTQQHKQPQKQQKQHLKLKEKQPQKQKHTHTTRKAPNQHNWHTTLHTTRNHHHHHHPQHHRSHHHLRPGDYSIAHVPRSNENEKKNIHDNETSHKCPKKTQQIQKEVTIRPKVDVQKVIERSFDRQDAEKFAQSLNAKYFECSTVTGEGIIELFEYIIKWHFENGYDELLGTNGKRIPKGQSIVQNGQSVQNSTPNATNIPPTVQVIPNNNKSITNMNNNNIIFYKPNQLHSSQSSLTVLSSQHTTSTSNFQSHGSSSDVESGNDESDCDRKEKNRDKSKKNKALQSETCSCSIM